MGTTMRSFLAAERRQQRDAQKRLRELEIQAKQHAKLSAIEQARLEVERYESGLEVLLSLHKERSEVLDWGALATSLPPHTPWQRSVHEFKAKLQTQQPGADPVHFDAIIEQARSKDAVEYRQALENYSKDKFEWERMRSLAGRVLAGEHKAYTEALVEFSGLGEISDLGSEIYFTVHTAKVLECSLKVSGLHAIPSETKSLTAAGKLSVKPTAKTRFQELYQDYVCSCVLRVAREVFALLPIETVIITASIDAVDTKTGHTVARPVLSVAFPHVAFSQLLFETVDPSDSVEMFLHRGDVKASRKSGEFDAVTPITPVDLPQDATKSDLGVLLELSKELRKQVQSDIANLPVTKMRISTLTAASI